MDSSYHSEAWNPVREGIVHLPVELEFDTYQRVFHQLMEAAHYAGMIQLYCCGVGGWSGGASSISDVINQIHYGLGVHVIGVATGIVCSANSVIWASCPQRICQPSGYLLVHQVHRVNEDPHHEHDMNEEMEILKYLNYRMAEVYSEASNRSVAWWEALLKKSTRTGTLLTRKKLIELGMIEEL